MDFNWLFAGIGVAVFISGYYLGWVARGKWDKNRLTLTKMGKELKKLREEKKNAKQKA